MRRRLLLALLCVPVLLPGQADFRVYTDHPRLFLEAKALRRLTRDVERETTRWRRLAELIAEDAALPEAPIVHALAYRIAADEESGRRAVDSLRLGLRAGTLGSPGRLRQAALVFDWCYDLLTPEERERFAAALGQVAAARAELAGSEIVAVRDGVLAAIAVAGDWDGAEPVLGAFLERQWESDLVPLLRAGELTDDAESLIALLEISHAVRYNLERELWLDAGAALSALPAARILSYLPGSIETEEGRVRVNALAPADTQLREREAVLGRVAEMMLVAYAPNPRDGQFLQGWLRNDSFTLTGPLGAFYEMLWINPYLPGLSPSSGLDLTYDPVRGRIFGRTGWEDDDEWIGYWAGRLHLRSGEGLREVSLSEELGPWVFPGVTVVLSGAPAKLEVEVEQGVRTEFPRIYWIGLEAGRRYNLRVNRNEWRLKTAGAGGILEIADDPDSRDGRIRFDKRVRLQIRKALEEPPGRGRPSLR